VEGDVAEDGEGAAVVASTLRHRECIVTVVIALFHTNTLETFSNFFSSFLLKNTIETLSLSQYTVSQGRVRILGRGILRTGNTLTWTVRYVTT
jgi:hypothetical protein